MPPAAQARDAERRLGIVERRVEKTSVAVGEAAAAVERDKVEAAQRALSLAEAYDAAVAAAEAALAERVLAASAVRAAHTRSAAAVGVDAPRLDCLLRRASGLGLDEQVVGFLDGILSAAGSFESGPGLLHVEPLLEATQPAEDPGPAPVLAESGGDGAAVPGGAAGGAAAQPMEGVVAAVVCSSQSQGEAAAVARPARPHPYSS